MARWTGCSRFAICSVDRMANWTFVTAVQEGARILDKSEGGILYEQCAEEISASGDKAVVVFAVFLFLFYTTFGVLLTMREGSQWMRL